MLNGRPKLGPAAGVNWQEAALGIGKNKRKTIGFGARDKRSKTWEVEAFIRELSIVDAGLGCALWDASIILARWIYVYGEQYLASRSLIELGCGCGLPGIVAARFCSTVVLTDYIESVIENAAYNVRTNAEAEDDPERQPSDAERAADARWRDVLRSRTRVMHLDWDKPPPEAELPAADVLIGSELTYSLLSVGSLSRLIGRLLRPGGFFLEVLSTDRDGVSTFVELMAGLGYEHEETPVEGRFLGAYGSRQRPEDYNLHVWYRKGEFPVIAGREAADGFFPRLPADSFWRVGQARQGMPVVVSERYNVRFTDLATSCQNLREVVALLRARADLHRGRGFVECDRRASDEELLLAHTEEYLRSIERGTPALLARVGEMSRREVERATPARLLMEYVEPQRWCARGTLMAVDLALERGWAVNTDGGLHHASGPRGGAGLCWFADVTMAARHYWRKRPGGKLMIIDFDVHRGNGHEGDLLKEARAGVVYIVDAYNNDLVPLARPPRLPSPSPPFPPSPPPPPPPPPLLAGVPQAGRAGALGEAGDRAGAPCTCATTDGEYRAALLDALSDAFREFSPEFIIYVIGYDVLEGDPNGHFHATRATVVEREAAVAAAARRAKAPLCALVANCGYQRGVAGTVAAALGRLVEVLEA
eukprot:tig00000319_g24130.t1